MSKFYLISTLSITVFLTACGQKGALYLPKDTTSEMPTVSQSDNPNDFTNVQNPNSVTIGTPTINPNAQNPNIKIQDSKNDY